MSHTAHNLYEIENVYPPKHPDTGEAASPLWYKGIYSIVLYLGLGYMLLRRWDLLLLIFGIVLLHELGHFFAMRYYHYTDIGILFLPFIGAWVQGNKNEIVNDKASSSSWPAPYRGYYWDCCYTGWMAAKTFMWEPFHWDLLHNY